MNGPRLLALVLGLAAVVAAVYLAFQKLGSPEQATLGNDLVIDLGSDSETVAAPAESATSTVPERADASDADRTSVAPLGRQLLVDVVLPSGSPPEPDLAVVAVPIERLDDDAPGPWLAEHGDETPEGGARAPVARNGRASLALPEGGGEFAVFVDGRFLYSDAVVVAPDATEVTLEPRVGGCLVVELDVLSGGEPAGELNFFGGDFGARSRGFEQREVEAANRSRIVFGGLNPDFAWSLIPDFDTHYASFAMGLELEPGQERVHTLRLSAGASVAGVVVDPDGNPLAGAQVRSDRDGGPPWAGRGDGVETDADGTFELRALRPGKRSFTAELDGWREGRTDELELLEGQRLEGLRIVLDRGLSIEGVVVWPDGRGPVEGARVSAETTVERRGFGSMSWSNVERAGRVETDADGRFAIRGLEEGSYTLRASGADPDAETDERLWRASQESVAAPSNGVQLTLRGPLAFSGRVVDDRGEPVAAFEITAESTEREGPDESQRFTSEDGTFLFARVGAGEWGVSAEADGHALEDELTLTLPHDGTPVELVLERRGSIRGRVVDPAGGPAAGAIVSVDDGRGGGGPWGRSFGASADAGDDGSFVLEDLRPGGLALTAADEEWASSESLAVELEPGQALDGFTLALRVGGRIEGSVVTPAGDPIPGQRVSYGANPMGFGDQDSTQTDAAGRFAFEHVTPGKWNVTASPSFEELGQKMQEDGAGEMAFLDVMGEMITKTVTVADGETVVVHLGGEPKRPVRVFGVVERDGEPLAGAQVFAVAEGGAILQGMKTAVAESDGRYELTVDRPGAYVVSARLGRQGVEVDVDVPRADEVRVDLFVPLGRITGRVERPDGRPLPGARLSIQREDGLGRMRWDGSQTVADDRGVYAFEDLEAGVYTVRANVAGFGGGADGDLGSAVIPGIVVEEDRRTSGVDFRLEKAGRVEGVVRGTDGQPVARASVFFRDEDGHLVSAVASTTTDATGRFEHDALAPGTYLVSVRADEHASNDEAAVTVRSGETSEVELAVETGTLVRVKLVDPDGLAKRSRVEVFDRDGREVGGLISARALRAQFTEGASSSEHEIGPLPPGRYRVIGTLSDGTTVDRSVRLRGEEVKEVTLRLD